MTGTNRIESIDIARGVGIILVIAGHSFQLSWSYPIYAFHLPLFFFITGLTTRSIDKKSFGKFISGNAKRLLTPWFVILSISALVSLVVPAWRNEIFFTRLAQDLYSANTNVFQNSSIWYLPCLWFALAYWYIIRRFTKKIPKTVTWIVTILFVIVAPYVFMRLRNLSLPGGRLPLKIDSAALGAMFLFLGGLNPFQNMISRQYVDWIDWFLAFVLSFIGLILALLNGWANMNSLDFGKYPYMYIPIAMVGVLAVVYLSRCLAVLPLKFIGRIFGYYGRNSLLIFGFQSLFLRGCILFYNKCYGLSMRLYAANPVKFQVLSFLLVTLVFSPLLVTGYDLARLFFADNILRKK